MARTRKSIGDLLREEAQKSPDQEDAAVQIANSEELPEDEVNTESLSTVIDSNNSATKRTNPTKADLEATITELRAALQEVQQHENSLQQQVADLQSELQDSKTSVQKLEAQLKQADQVKAELEQAKKVILQLTETNSKPKQEVYIPKKENVSFKPQNSALTRLPEYPQPVTERNEVFNADVGWFD